MAYMQCYRPVEQDPCYQQAKPHSAAGIYDTFQQHTNQQQQHHNAHGFPQTNSAAGYTNFNGGYNTHKPSHGQGYGVTPYQTHSNSNVSGYNTHKYSQHGQGAGFITSKGHPAHHGSQTMSSAVGSFKSEKKMKEKFYSSEYKKKSSGHKNKNKCGNDSGSDSSSGSDSD